MSRLEWPDSAYGQEREDFYAKLMQALVPGAWIAVVPTPAPLGAVRERIEVDCRGVLEPLPMAHDGVAWLCRRLQLPEALPGLFHARRPELVFLVFDDRPEPDDIGAALASADAQPACGLLVFEDGELVEAQPPGVLAGKTT